MEYTIDKLAKMAGITTRALRHYDDIGLLKPNRITPAGYRIYGQKEINLLQQILFYKELGVSLTDIKIIISSPSFDNVAALENHLVMLVNKKNHLDLLITNVEKSILAMKGEIVMKDNEKFIGFKEKLINDNEKQYGKEIREKYGEDTVRKSNEKLRGLSKELMQKVEDLCIEINKTLKIAFELKDPASEVAQKVCALHKEWLCIMWPDGTYTKEAHKNLGEMYVNDERFKAYYDNVAMGAAEFLRDALRIYCRE